MARRIAIDLGAYAVKVSILRQLGDADDLELELRQRVPQDGTEVPTLADRLAALDRLIHDHREVADGAHLSALVWPSDRAATHRIALPFADTSKIDDTLPFAVEAEVPFELDEMVLAWRATETPGVVLVPLVRGAALAEAVGGLAQRALDPRRVFTTGDVLGAYARGPLTTAVIDVGHTQTVVAVARDGRTLLSRSIGVAGRAFTRAIQDALQCAWHEAEALKHGDADPLAEATVRLHDEPDPDVDLVDPPSGAFEIEEAERTDPGELAAVGPRLEPGGALPAVAQARLEGTLGLLLASVRATLVEAEDALGLGIEQVVLTGGGAKIAGLRDYLAADLGLEVLDATDTQFGLVPPSFAASRAMGQLVAGDDTGCSDLRVGDLAYRGGVDLPRTVLQVAGAAVAAFLVMVVVLFAYYGQQLSSELATVEAAIVEVVHEAAPASVDAGLDASGAVSWLGDLVYEAQQQADFLGSDGTAPPVVHLLYRLTRGFPDHPGVEVELDKLEISPGAIHLEGVADDFSDVDQIGETLKSRGGFVQVDATPGKKQKDKLEFAVDIVREGATDEDLGEEG